MTPRPYSTQISGWGRYPRVDAMQVRSEDLEAVTEQASLTRGLGRSYGDASLPSRGDRVVADSTLADRLLAFDSETGLLRAEAGLSLEQLNRIFLPRGWFPPVSPGTQWVTLGGMVLAADVHGKNHHVAGTFGEHVRTLVADGRVLECSDEKRFLRARARITCTIERRSCHPEGALATERISRTPSGFFGRLGSLRMTRDDARFVQVISARTLGGAVQLRMDARCRVQDGEMPSGVVRRRAKN